MANGPQRIGVSADVPGLTVSAFHDGKTDSVVLVGVKEGGPKHIELALPQASVESWDVYMTTRSLDCAKTAAIATVNGVAELDLPDEAVFTLVGKVKP